MSDDDTVVDEPVEDAAFREQKAPTLLDARQLLALSDHAAVGAALDQSCRFAIGETVAMADELRVSVDGVAGWRAAASEPLCPHTIIERIAVQCYAGTQVQYGVRRTNNRTGASILERFWEYELVPWQAACEVHREHVQALRNAKP